ncbi:nuclear pore complex protein Nup214 isoform X2 [Manduca sexta]|uniref:nuclear pore complex protein Nup214 isoform X2 n=1 Tax=Manduca sexta TaxID=7130 RepID=UPI0018902B6E|nr:nuclear pore complex protein Nup214 isoform X2 [Manduca sexta]
MDVQYGPNAVDEPNLLYKLQHKIKVFETQNPLQNRGYNLVASSSKYGILFVAVPNGLLTAYYLNQVIDKECEPQHTTTKLQEMPTHIGVNCTQELLAVTGGQLICVFKVTDFQNQNTSPSAIIKTEASPSTFVSSMQWNPCNPDSLALAMYDGTLIISQVSTNQLKKVQSKARCICWSPKGKQLVTGNSDGTLCQYLPELTVAKTVVAPNLFSGCSTEAMAIHWISTFQFAVVYKNATDNSRPALTIVHAGKTGQPTCHNYEDICFSQGSHRPWFYYLQGIAQWNLILASSSNSMEIATLSSPDGASWMQWCQPDEARPELPLTDKKLENYPVGVCIDTCAIQQLPWGENEVLPYMPRLHVLSQSGLLTIFNIVNLNKSAAQLCTPQQQLALPAAAMTSIVPSDVPPKPQPTPAPAPAPVPIQKPQPLPAQAQPIQIPSVPKTSPFMPSMNNASQPAPQPQISANKATAPFKQAVEQKETKPVLAQSQPQPLPQAQQQPQPAVPQAKPLPKAQQPPQMQENAALKAEQEKINKEKANQELKNMLVKEVNDFQMELYKFMVKTRETQAKLQQDIDAINLNIEPNSLDTEQLRKECSLDELRGTIAQFKLELVRTCAIMAEARTHAEVKDMEQWTQVDPLTIKRIASVKKLAYYVQNQLEQTRQALDYKWNEMESKDNYKSGSRMVRPRLDEVYQLLVRQQEILSRQQAVLRTLRNTATECDVTPVFKSTSILRSTPFRNKDPLSKLTKNILNMSIEPQTKKPLLTAQKIDALRDLLANHKPIKIKPVNVELRQHLATMKLNYERSMREKEAVVTVKVKQEHVEAPKFEPKFVPAQPKVKLEVKPEPVIQMPASGAAFTPVANVKPAAPAFGNVARTLFNDVPKPEPPKPVIQPTIPVANPQPFKVQSHGFAPLNTASASAATKSVLKDLLQNKSQANLEAKNDANTFMGQKICSPTSFVAPPIATTAPVILKDKQLSTSSNVFPKFQPQAFIPESKPQMSLIPKSNETDEFEAAASTKPFEAKNTNLFGSTANVPDVLKSHNQEITKVESKPILKIPEKVIEISKENVPKKDVPKLTPTADKKDVPRILSSQSVNIKPPVSIATSLSTSSNESQKTEIKEVNAEVPKPAEKSELKVTSNASSIFANANITIPTAPKFQPAVIKPIMPTPQLAAKSESVAPPEPKLTEDSQPKAQESEVTTTVSSSSIFAAAATSQSKTTAPTGSIFNSSTPLTTPSAFSSQGSIFGASTGSSSVFGSDTSKPSIFSTPSSTASSIFGTAKTQAGSIFAPTTTEAPTAAAVFGTATTTQSAFSSTSSVFGTAASAPSSVFSGSSSIFGTAATTTQSSLFGTPATSSFATTTTSSIFGSVTTTTQSIFGATPATQASVFGSTGQTSVFGSAPTTQSSLFSTTGQTGSVFGAPTSTTQPSVFGTPTSTTQPSVFGTPTSTTQPSVFGTPTSTAQPSVFGTPTSSAQPSVFGTPASTTQPSVFGTPTPSTQASIFGTPTQTTQTSVFGAPAATTAQSGSLFGVPEGNLFASASISTTSAPSQGGSIFGGSTSGSVFGSSGTSVFGSTTFGQPNPTAAAIFGGATSGQKPATNFWSGGGATSGGGFGSSTFGQQSTTQASSIFGSGSGGSFSAPQPAGTTAFSSPQQGSAFGAAPSFGGSPVFGSKPVFGQSGGFSSPTGGGFGSFGGFNKSPSSGFGGPASFGGAPTFGNSAFGNTSPGKVFGGSPAPAFGSPTQSNARFESLATQNTLTFGNLAQQSGQPAPQPPSFNTSPSFTGWRG